MIFVKWFQEMKHAEIGTNTITMSLWVSCFGPACASPANGRAGCTLSLSALPLIRYHILFLTLFTSITQILCSYISIPPQTTSVYELLSLALHRPSQDPTRHEPLSELGCTQPPSQTRPLIRHNGRAFPRRWCFTLSRQWR